MRNHCPAKFQPLHLIGICLDENQRTYTMKHKFNMDWTMYLDFINYSTLNNGGPMYLIEKSTNMCF